MAPRCCCWKSPPSHRRRRAAIARSPSMLPKPLLALLLLTLSLPAFADSGMWTFHDFPTQQLQHEYGTEITHAWLDKVRTATIRLSNCTASFVSADGLILTNHH